MLHQSQALLSLIRSLLGVSGGVFDLTSHFNIGEVTVTLRLWESVVTAQLVATALAVATSNQIKTN